MVAVQPAVLRMTSVLSSPDVDHRGILGVAASSLGTWDNAVDQQGPLARSPKHPGFNVPRLPDGHRGGRLPVSSSAFLDGAGDRGVLGIRVVDDERGAGLPTGWLVEAALAFARPQWSQLDFEP